VTGPVTLDPTEPPVTGLVGERWYTVADVAELLDMSQEWVRDRIKDQSLKAKRITNAGRGQYRVSDSAIAAFMASRPDAT
jgi:excisionase family DNA binding protein